MADDPSNRDLPLRIVAVVGLISAAVAALTTSTTPTGHGWSAAFVALFISAAAIGTALVFMRAHVHALAANPDVFVPTGLAMLAGTLVSLSALILPASFLATGSFQLLGLSLSVSIAVIGMLVITIVQIIWTTLMLVDIAAGREVDLRSSLARTRTQFLRGSLVIILGYAGTLAILGLAMQFLTPASIAAGVLSGSVLTVVWNAGTLALLVAVLDDSEPLGRALGRGLRASPRVSLDLLGPMICVLAVLGVLSAAYTSTSSFGDSSTSWQVNCEVKWLPALPEDSGWYSTWCKVWEVPPNEFIVFLTSLPLMVMTFAFGLRVVEQFSPEVDSV